MDPKVKSILLEVMDLMHSMVASPQCGFHFCEHAMADQDASPCEHIETCRKNFQLAERIETIKHEIDRAANEEPVAFCCTVKGGTD